MIISQANSIRFRPVNSDLPNYENTFVADEKFHNDKIFTYCQRWLTTDSEKVVIRTEIKATTTAITAVATLLDKSTVNLTVTQISSYDQDGDGTDDLWYYEVPVVMSQFTAETYITITQGSTVYKSEPFKGCSDLLDELLNGDAHRIEYYNEDNAFNIDSSTGITFSFYVESVLRDYITDGEPSTYDNQDEVEKLKETVQRAFLFRTEYIPRYMAEKIKLSSSMDNFVVNDLSYIREEQPEITPVEDSNFVELSMNLIDKEYLGINSDDIGFDCDVVATDAEVSVLTELNASGGVTFIVPAGYQIHTIRAEWVSGTSVQVKLGTTVGGDELAYPFNVSSTLTQVTSAIHQDLSRASNTDAYATVTGGVADLDLQIIQNKETGT